VTVGANSPSTLQIAQPIRELAHVVVVPEDTALGVVALGLLAVLGVLLPHGIRAVLADDGGLDGTVLGVVIIGGLAVEAELRNSPLERRHSVLGRLEVAEHVVETATSDGRVFREALGGSGV
jgi:hypothetical protein